MKKYIFTLSVLLTCLVSVTAQEEREIPTAEERAQMQTEIMKERLELTHTQETQVYDINLESAKEMPKLKELPDKMSKFKKFRDIQFKKDKSLKKVMNKKQYKEYTKMKKELKKLLKDRKKEKKKK